MGLLQWFQVALRRNIMGLVTNIAEVPEYRKHLLSPAVLHQLENCMAIDVDRLEVSYNVAGRTVPVGSCAFAYADFALRPLGTLCHIMAEGEEYWYSEGLSASQRESLLVAVASAVSGWNKATERWINYRSLLPIILLLRPGIPDQVYLWSTWALLSLYVCELVCCLECDVHRGILQMHGDARKIL